MRPAGREAREASDGSFADLARATRELAGYPHPWYVCGGWAIDLFVGRATREHEDVEIGVFRRDQEALRGHLATWGAFKSIGGWTPWRAGELLELPIHQILFRPPGSGPPADPWEPSPEELQFFLEDVENGVWTCRRDARLTRPAGDLTAVAPDGTPFVVPEIQLLYKAKHHGDKDERDFREVVPRLSELQRSWLRGALELVHPGDPWLEQLAG